MTRITAGLIDAYSEFQNQSEKGEIAGSLGIRFCTICVRVICFMKKQM